MIGIYESKLITGIHRKNSIWFNMRTPLRDYFGVPDDLSLGMQIKYIRTVMGCRQESY
jgi:hypothetical protein